MKACCDLLGAAGCRISDDDQILYILGGLGHEYDPVMVSITSRIDPWKVQEVRTILLSYETRLEGDKQSSVNLEGSQPSLNLVHQAQQKKDVPPQQG